MAEGKDICCDDRRCRKLNSAPESNAGQVLYWMSRDQRCDDNWALIYAQQLACKRSSPLHVAFCLVPRFLDATLRQYDFMLCGLREVEMRLRDLQIPFHLLLGNAEREIPQLCHRLGITSVVCDMSPLRVPSAWSRDLADACDKLNISVTQVDAHNIVPVWCSSDKQEYAARTIRKKIMLQLPSFLTEFQPLIKHPSPEMGEERPLTDWEAAEKSLQIDRSVKPVGNIFPGSAAGKLCLEEFCSKRLAIFAEKRNDPNVDALSGLSPYLHFGQLSAQRCVLRVKEAARAVGGKIMKGSCDAYIEEAVVRRELSDNFCFYNEKYDEIEGAPGWAQITLREHENDEREYLYSVEDLESARTHDDLWNAAQLQMLHEGKMHGFLRMYWAKKILEWSPSPRIALQTAIRLNDRYELDGRDPNGYVGCMWSICGVHDQGWAERSVFGKIRFMNYAGCKRKLDVNNFVSRYPGARGPVSEQQTLTKRHKKK